MIRKQKIAIAVTAALLIVGALVGSGITTGSLSSNATGGGFEDRDGGNKTFICSAEALESEKSTYERYIVKLQQGEEVIARLANELTDLSNEQTSQEALLATTQTNIATLQSTKSSLESYIRRSCSNPRTPQQRSECSKKRSELAKVSKNLLAEQKNETKAKLKLKQIAQRTGQALSKVTTQETQMTSYRQYMATYDECKIVLQSAKLYVEIDNAGGGLLKGKNTGIYSIGLSNDGDEDMYVYEIVFEIDTKGVYFNKFEAVTVDVNGIESRNSFTCLPDLVSNSKEYINCIPNSEEGWYIGKNKDYYVFGLDPYVSNIETPGRNTTLLLKEIVYGNGKAEMGKRRGFISSNNRPINFTSVQQNVCGNNIREENEQCDDGNMNNQDGCSNICQNTPTQSIVEVRVSCGGIPNNAASGCNECKMATVSPGSRFAPYSWFEVRDNSMSSEEISLEKSSIYAKTYQNVSATQTGDITDIFDLSPIPSLATWTWTWANIKEDQSITLYDVEPTINFNNPVYSIFFTTNSSLRGVLNSERVNTSCLFVYPRETAYCGNEVIDQNIGEQCDDGNIINDDGCSNLCKLEIVPANSNFRFSSWTCYDGTNIENTNMSSCKSRDTWQSYAQQDCEKKCSPDTGKCGVDSFNVSEVCS